MLVAKILGMQNTILLSISMVASTLFLAEPAWAAHPMAAWVRSPGVYGKDLANPGKINEKRIDLDTLPQQQGQRPDAQYGTTANYRGVLLRDLIEKYGPPAQVDLVLLHFHNGMIVPLPFRDARAMKRLDPLIALGRSAAADAPYLAEFPPIDRSVEGYADVRQVTFAGNKLVVSERWHPELSAQAIESFSPWQTTSSLTGIEFVEANAYYRQFLPTADVRPGFEIFRHNCQFCHGVNKVGASYGWDYATPLPLHTYRSNPERLYMHIHYRVEYKATWQKMPALKHVTEPEAALLWQWMRAASSAPTPAYTPTR